MNSHQRRVVLRAAVRAVHELRLPTMGGVFGYYTLPSFPDSGEIVDSAPQLLFTVPFDGPLFDLKRVVKK